MSSVDQAAAEPGPTAPASRRRRLPRMRRRDGRAPLTLELALVAWLFYLYDVINNLAPARIEAARSHAAGMLSFERSLGIDVERTLNRWLSGHAVIAFITTYYYFFAHVLVTFAVLAWLWWRRPSLYGALRTQLVIINLIAFAVFWRYPLAPPRMLPDLGYQDVVAQSHAVFSWHSGALVHDANQYAAMPSLHFAWAAWSGLALWQLLRGHAARALAGLHPLLTGVIVIATGNHWLLDVLAGTATWLVAVGLQGLLWRLPIGSGRRPIALPELGERGAAGLGVTSNSAAAVSAEALAQTSSGPT